MYVDALSSFPCAGQMPGSFSQLLNDSRKSALGAGCAPASKHGSFSQLVNESRKSAMLLPHSAVEKTQCAAEQDRDVNSESSQRSVSQDSASVAKGASVSSSPLQWLSVQRRLAFDGLIQNDPVSAVTDIDSHRLAKRRRHECEVCQVREDTARKRDVPAEHIHDPYVDESWAPSGPWSCKMRQARPEDCKAIAAAPGKFFLEEISHSEKELKQMSNLHVMELTSSAPQWHTKEAYRVAGYVSWERKGDRAELVALAVHVDFRRLGFGRQLLLLAMVAAERSGAKRMELQVRPGNVVARALYQEHGFTEVSVLPRYYGGLRAGVLMRTELCADETPHEEDMHMMIAESRLVTGVVAGFQVSAGSHDAWAVLARAVEQAASSVKRRGWQLREVLEMPLQGVSRCGFQLQGYNPDNGRLLVCMKGCRGVSAGSHAGPYKEILATLLHELVHFEILGHGPAFYKEYSALVNEVCGDDPEFAELSAAVRAHVWHVELARRMPTCWRAFHS